MVLQRNNNGDCEFLDKEGRCQLVTLLCNSSNFHALALNTTLPLPTSLADDTHQKLFLSPVNSQPFSDLTHTLRCTGAGEAQIISTGFGFFYDGPSVRMKHLLAAVTYCT